MSGVDDYSTKDPLPGFVYRGVPQPWEQKLDAAARTNLTPQKLQEYQRYKAELIANGDDDPEAVLRGAIWDWIEEESALEEAAEDQADA